LGDVDGEEDRDGDKYSSPRNEVNYHHVGEKWCPNEVCVRE